MVLSLDSEIKLRAEYPNWKRAFKSDEPIQPLERIQLGHTLFEVIQQVGRHEVVHQRLVPNSHFPDAPMQEAGHSRTLSRKLNPNPSLADCAVYMRRVVKQVYTPNLNPGIERFLSDIQA